MKRLLVIAASAWFMAGAQAQPAAPDAPASAPTAKKAASRTDRVEAHIKKLHQQLKITSAEEAQWNKVADTMRENAQEMDALIAKRQSGEGSMNAVDDLNSYGELAQAHADGVKKMSAAFSPLYDSMPDEQKKIADAVFHHRPHHGKKGHKAD